MAAPLIVGIGGATRAGSSSELLVRAALAEAARLGARTALISGPDMMVPIYTPHGRRGRRVLRMLELLRTCDGVILASPAYHGSISGLIKNALDYIEDLRGDARPYLDGRAVGCIACAAGGQGAGPVLAALRSIVHALRGWPSPLGVAVTPRADLFDAAGAYTDAVVSTQLAVMAEQVVSFASAYGAAAREIRAARNPPSRDIIFTPPLGAVDHWL